MQYIKALIMVFLTTVFFASCSGDMESDEKTKTIHTQTEQIGHEAAEMIKIPMDKAQGAVDRENERLQKLDKRLSD